MSLKSTLIFAGVVLLMAVVGAIGFTVSSNIAQGKIVALQNEVAKRDTTIEVQKGVYQKLTLQNKDLRELLDKDDVQLKLLQEQLAKSGANLLAANTLIVKLKTDLKSSGNVVVMEPDPKYPDIVRLGLDSKDDFAPFRVTGEVVTDCSMEQNNVPSASLKLSQTRPLKLSVVVSQDKDGTWKTSTTSSEENFQIDIGLSAVNPYMLEPKWYEKIGLQAEIAAGSGILVGVGATYKIGKFQVGPKVWGAMNWDLTPRGYAGVTLGWNPFERN